MSELTQCNFCKMQEIKRHARFRGQKVETKAEPFHVWGAGVAVFVDGEKVSWFAKLPDHCCC